MEEGQRNCTKTENTAHGKVPFMRDKLIRAAINRTSFPILTSFVVPVVNVVFLFFSIGILFVTSPFYSYLLKNK